MNNTLPAFPDLTVRDRVRTAIGQGNYTEPSLCQFFGVATALEAAPLAELVLSRKTTPHSALTLLLRLFFQGTGVAVEEVTDTLGAAATAAFTASGLLAEEAGEFLATAQLVPLGDLIVASDRPARHAAGRDDFVVGPAPVSKILFEWMIRRPAQNVLDLGCGSGVLALLAAASSQKVVATDINSRAIALCRFNAQLNGIEHLQVVAGDLFAGVAGERFDLIICNPPFVISPQSEFIYRDSGQGIGQRIIREAPRYLEIDGFLQILCNWPESADTDWRKGPASWFEDSACDTWVLRLHSFPIATYTSVWLSQQFRGQFIPPHAFDEWMSHLEKLGAKSVGHGLVVMRPARGRKPWLDIRDAPGIRGPAGDAIVAGFERRDLLARLDSDAALFELKLRPAENLQRTTIDQAASDGWTAPRTELAITQGLLFAAKVDPLAAGLIGMMDGRHSVRELMAKWRQQHDSPTERFLEQWPTALRQLVELGLLVPA